MKIDVTYEDINAGIPNRCIWCPIALAVKRITGKVARVGINRLELFDGCWMIDEVKLPEIANQFIRDFDGGMICHPITFELDFAGDSNNGK